MKSRLDKELGRISTSVTENSSSVQDSLGRANTQIAEMQTLQESLSVRYDGLKESVEKLSIQGLHTAYQ